MKSVNGLLSIATLLALTACGPGEGGPEQVDEHADEGQCVEQEAACPTCDGKDVVLAIGTRDHEPHLVDARAARDAAKERNFVFLDPLELTDDDATSAAKVVDALHAIEGPVRTLVLAIHGHGARGALTFMDGSRLEYGDLFAAVMGVDACQVFVSNDSCYSGSMFDDIPDQGLAKCSTVAASSVGPDTKSQCRNGLSKEFEERVLRGDPLRTALEEAGASYGVQHNTTPGQFRTYANPDCTCARTDCIERTRIGDGAARVEQPANTPAVGTPVEEQPVEEIPGEGEGEGEGETFIGCDPETYVDHCDGDTAFSCATGDLTIFDCGALNKTCEVAGDVAICVEREGACGDIPPAGVCEDADTILMCEGGDLYTLDCDAGQQCHENEIGAYCE